MQMYKMQFPANGSVPAYEIEVPWRETPKLGDTWGRIFRVAQVDATTNIIKMEKTGCSSSPAQDASLSR